MKFTDGSRLPTECNRVKRYLMLSRNSLLLVGARANTMEYEGSMPNETFSSGAITNMKPARRESTCTPYKVRIQAYLYEYG